MRENHSTPTIEREKVLIPTRDGTRLAASLHWPPGSGRQAKSYPALVEYHPYRIDDRSFRRVSDHDYFARKGFVSVRLEVRGTGSSEGVNTDEYMAVETSDGYDAVEWLAARPWSSGAVGMFGSSYGGFTSLQVAVTRPPHLKAIVPMYATDDRYTDDCHYKGGALRAFYDLAAYGTSMVAQNALPPGDDLWGDEWEEMWEQRLAANTPYMLNWLANQTDGPYWRRGSLRGHYEEVRAATFMIGGWQDGYPNPLFRTYTSLRCPRKLLVGPWNHALPNIAVPGPRIDYRREMARWFNLHLRGEDDGISKEPHIAIFVQRHDAPDPSRDRTSGEWRAERRWPPRGARDRVLYLCGDPEAGSGLLSPRRARDGAASVRYDPTAGVVGGLWSGGVPFGLPGDQRRDEALSIVYTGTPLRRPLTIAGAGAVILFASSTARVSTFVVKVADVAPDGSSALVTRGVLNGTRRAGMESPEPMTPGELYELEIPLDSTAWSFEKGHRIRLAVSGADFPNSWPTPEPAELAVQHGRSRPSRLRLPAIPASGERPPELAPPPAASNGAGRERPVWRFTDGPMTGDVSLELGYGGWSDADRGGRIYGRNELTLTANRKYPAKVQAAGRAVIRLERGGRTIEATAEQEIRSDAAAFHLTVNRLVSVDGEERDRRQWTKSFPRELL